MQTKNFIRVSSTSFAKRVSTTRTRTTGVRDGPKPTGSICNPWQRNRSLPPTASEQATPVEGVHSRLYLYDTKHYTPNTTEGRGKLSYTLTPWLLHSNGPRYGNILEVSLEGGRAAAERVVCLEAGRVDADEALHHWGQPDSNQTAIRWKKRRS